MNESGIAVGDVAGRLDFFLSPFLTRIVLSAIILLVGFIIGKLIGALARRILGDLMLDRRVMGFIGLKFSLERFIGGLLSYAIYAGTIIWTLNVLGLTTAIMTIIAFAVIFIISVSFLLAIKDFFPNLLSGLRIKMKGSFVLGDQIQIKEVKGVVKRIGWFDTMLVTSFNEEVIIPNAIFSRRQIIVRRKSEKKYAVQM